MVTHGFRNQQNAPAKNYNCNASPLAQFTFLVHSHMLRHAAGSSYDGQDTRAIQAYLGHRSIMSTVRIYGFDAQSVQELLERLNGGVSQSETMPHARREAIKLLIPTGV
jgi:integrase